MAGLDHLHVKDLARIALNGGGMTLSAKKYDANDLARIALNGAVHRARIVITDAVALQVNDIARIALNGGGAVSFE